MEEKDLLRTLKGREDKIHILMETQTFDRGGLEQVVFNLAKGLDRVIFKTVIVAVQKGGYFAARCKEFGIPVEVLEHDKAREYQEVLERYQIDIVLSHYSTFGSRLAFEKGIPTLSVIHNVYTWFPDNVLSEFKSADPFVSGYISVSEEVKQYTHYRFNIPLEKIGVIPNGIDLDEYLSQSPSKTICRSELDLKEDDYVFINVASVGPPKGQNVILAALEKIVQEYPCVKVLSVGGVLDEAYAHFLKERIEALQLSGHFKLIGSVEDVRPYLQIADAFLLTSLIEGWPLSIMEAMLYQLPVITTRVGGVSEILGDSGGGVLLNNTYDDFRLLDVPSLDQLSRETSPRNAGEVARAMKRFFEEKETWRQLGRKGPERISGHFSLQGMVRSYERELFSLYIAMEKSRGLHRLRKIQEQEKLIFEEEKTIEDLRVHHEQLNSKIDLRFENIEKHLDYILIRLSVKERVKGVIYCLMKQVHKLAPVAIREKYQKVYRRAFFDKVTPADKKLFFDQGTTSRRTGVVERGGGISTIRPLERNPIQDFLDFKERIKRGLPLELEKFSCDYIPGLVSVVLPVFNQAYLLGGSIESVLNQTYRNLEVIIVDDGSTDDIENVLELCRENPKVRIFHQENQKLPSALSNGFREAKGEFFTWTSADNLMGPRQLESQVEFLLSHPHVQMVYANYDIIGDDGRPLLNSEYCSGYQRPFGSNHIHLPRDLSELNVIRNNYIGPCFMYRSWVGRLVGDYNASMFTMEDYDYWMIINALFRIEHLDKNDSFYFNRVHPDSLTGKKKELKIVEKTDQLMEFEKARREFYQEKFNIYLLGNDDHLIEIEGPLKANGNAVNQFHIPCEDIKMKDEKALGIWIASPLEKGFVSRVMKENSHAFFVMIQLDPENNLEEELIKHFGMKVFTSQEAIGNHGDNLKFYTDNLSSSLYPILCKANIELFRRKESFDRWNP